MLEVYLRPIYQSCFLNPIANWTKKFPPKRITYLACFIGIMVAPALISDRKWIATFLLLISGFLDTLDGAVSRLVDKVTEEGAILDIVSDRIVELAVMLGLFAVDTSTRAWPTLAMLGSCYLCISCFLVVGIFSPTHSGKKGFNYSPGLIERAEAFIFFLFMFWLPDYFQSLAAIFAGLVLLTSYLHLKQFSKFKIMHTIRQPN